MWRDDTAATPSRGAPRGREGSIDQSVWRVAETARVVARAWSVAAGAVWQEGADCAAVGRCERPKVPRGEGHPKFNPSASCLGDWHALGPWPLVPNVGRFVASCLGSSDTIAAGHACDVPLIVVHTTRLFGNSQTPRDLAYLRRSGPSRAPNAGQCASAPRGRSSSPSRPRVTPVAGILRPVRAGRPRATRIGIFDRFAVPASAFAASPRVPPRMQPSCRGASRRPAWGERAGRTQLESHQAGFRWIRPRAPSHRFTRFQSTRCALSSPAAPSASPKRRSRTASAPQERSRQ